MLLLELAVSIIALAFILWLVGFIVIKMYRVSYPIIALKIGVIRQAGVFIFWLYYACVQRILF
ncbi:hypothetical protein B4914_05315 [Yersinia entomophaga]|nr:hypothetical protein B4914_05315 [Yersinia entomophaga]